MYPKEPLSESPPEKGQMISLRELQNKVEEEDPGTGDWLPEPGLACRVGEIIYNISVHQSSKHEKKLCIRPILGNWTPTRLKQCGHNDTCRCMGTKVSCDPRHEPKKIELVGGNLIIGEDSDEKKIEVLLSGLPKEERLIKSVTTYGHKEGDRISVLCNTGEIFMLTNTAKHHERPIIIDNR